MGIGKSIIGIWLSFSIPGCLETGFCAEGDAQSPSQAVSSKSDDSMRQSWAKWNEPVEPFKIFGNIYYAGAAGVSSFLIATPEGHILIDTGFEMTVPRITNSLARLGFRLEDIKILLSSHAHLDHTGGHALMKSLTGAQIYMSAPDAKLLASGGTADYTPYANSMSYARTAADHILADAEKVTLGGSTLVCHLTPGHTKGCTTWTMDAKEGSEKKHIVFFGSTTVLEGVKLLNNPKYPNLVADYSATFEKLKALPCDIFLAPHGSFFGLQEKAARLARNEQPNPFIQPREFSEFVVKSERAFQNQLVEEKARNE